MGRINGAFGSTEEPQVGERQTELVDLSCQSNGCRALAISSLPDSGIHNMLHAGFGLCA